MTDGNAPAARGYPDNEQEFLEDNIATVAHHLGQPGARLTVDHIGYKSSLSVDPGEVLKEISRRLTRDPAQQQPEPSHVSAGTIDNILSKLDQGAAHQGYPEGRFGFSWTQLARDAATIIRRLRLETERANHLLADAQRIIAEYQAGTIAGARADVAAHGMPGARGRSVLIGWRLVPERATDVQMDAGLYQSSRDATWADVYSIYADMIDAASSPDDGPIESAQASPALSSTVLSPPDASADIDRCPICDWPMAESQEKGCIPGDCSYRPSDPAEQERLRRRRAELSSTPRGDAT